MNKNKDLFQITIISMMAALLIVQTFVPIFGYIPLGPIDITIVHITVILTAVLFGKKIGLIIGTFWGALSMFRAFIQPTPFNIVFLNPLISILPRLLVGLISAIIFKQIKSRFSERVSYAITGGIGSLTNTVFVLSGIYFFASEAYARALGISENALLGALGTVVLTNGIIEMIASVILLPLFAIPLEKVLKRKNKNYQ